MRQQSSRCSGLAIILDDKHVVDGDRPPTAHDRLRRHRGVITSSDRDLRQLLRLRAVLVHVALRIHRVVGDACCAPWVLELTSEHRIMAIAESRSAPKRGMRNVWRPCRICDEHDVGAALANRRRRQRSAAPATRPHLRVRVEPQRRAEEVDVGAVRVPERVVSRPGADQAVDVTGVQARVAQRAEHGLHVDARGRPALERPLSVTYVPTTAVVPDDPIAISTPL